MYIIQREFSANLEVKKSNFIAHLVPLSEFERVRERLKYEHPKARHIVWAYRALNEYSQIVENQSDDGEPKSTSGPSCLNALRGAGLIDTAVLVVRYFGGIKLGTGGLVRAYGGAVNLAINASELVLYELKKPCEFFVPFAQIAKFEHFMKKQNFAYTLNFTDTGAVFSCALSRAQTAIFADFAQGFIAPFEILKLPEF
ncbi:MULTISPECIES: IMPACT family protein [unclassified Campylobacter]|uniref:IMPACT family protein n=1 Tax=unclassified Campylobacter TaxID=2593542 RepID=UPI0022E9CE35|nr:MULTISPECIES: YigZ family protein [unclassified Campylobacter]MDA3045261.1 IMPACT family protein [Campylobacter sp. JMF_07 ED4]MDA3064448.1 IMPACT family protein [Campylobacter sp. JMF_11 EL3]MDA3072590.1 IMPACT family protein [Campylobacter sp. VBCF_03 NA9]MDA3075643.1 IMPACT family protein [Campylobacter sp. JMF_05 ED3]